MLIITHSLIYIVMEIITTTLIYSLKRFIVTKLQLAHRSATTV